MKKSLVVAMLSVIFAGQAFAADEEMPYVGIGFGSGKLGVAPSAAGMSTTSSSVVGGIFGYQYDKNFAIELQFTGVGQAIDTAGNTVKGDALSLSSIGLLPVSDSFELLGKIGVATTKTTTSAAASNTGTSSAGLTFGLGAQYNLNRDVGLRLVLDRYSAATLDATGTKNSSNANVMTIGAIYKF